MEEEKDNNSLEERKQLEMLQQEFNEEKGYRITRRPRKRQPSPEIAYSTHNYRSTYSRAVKNNRKLVIESDSEQIIQEEEYQQTPQSKSKSQSKISEQNSQENSQSQDKQNQSDENYKSPSNKKRLLRKFIKKQKHQDFQQSESEQPEEETQDIQTRFAKLERQMNDLLFTARECVSDFLMSGKGKVTPAHQIIHKRNQKLKRQKKIIDSDSENEKNGFYKPEIKMKLNMQPSVMQNGELQPHQIIGLNWLIQMYENNVSVILADDMGLGKTIQIIALIAYLQEFKSIQKHFLIVCPKSTLTNWENEFNKWLPTCKVVKVAATLEEREIALKQIRKRTFDVCLTTYEGVKKSYDMLKNIKFKGLIVDEAHKLKNEQTQLSEVLRCLNYNHSILLTGTPLQNNLHELWALLNFVMPEIFENQEIFDNWFEINRELVEIMTQDEIEVKNRIFIQKLHKILEIFMLRRTKQETLTELPPKKEVHIYPGLTKLQVARKSPQGSSSQNKHYHNLLIQLRKVCCHPYLFEEIEDTTMPIFGQHIINVSGKMIVLDQLLQKLYQEKHQVVLFSQFTTMLNILEDYCTFRNFKFARIDGSSSLEDRDQQLADFRQEGSDYFIFLLSTRAGGLGINLQTADTVIIYDSDFNPQVDMQAIDRVHRYGQLKQVNVYRLITENTVEEKIRERQYIKLKWDSLVIQQKQKINDKLDKDSMKQIVNFGASKIVKAKNGTISNENIEELLKRGEDKTKKELQEIDEMLKQQNLGLALNSIDCQKFNIKAFDDDQIAIDEMQAKQILSMQDIQGQYQIAKEPKEVTICEYHFYEDPVRLKELLQTEENARFYKELYFAINATPTLNIQAKMLGLDDKEVLEKQKIINSGFSNWNDKEFEDFCSALHKYRKEDYEQIQIMVETKTMAEIEKYSEIFWKKQAQVFQDKEFILHILDCQRNMKENNKNNIFINWKCKQYDDPKNLKFDTDIYKKIISLRKNNTLWHQEFDEFFIYCQYEYGYQNWERIAKELKLKFSEDIWKGRMAEKNKRLKKLIQVLEKEYQSIQEKNRANGIKEQNLEDFAPPENYKLQIPKHGSPDRKKTDKKIEVNVKNDKKQNKKNDENQNQGKNESKKRKPKDLEITIDEEDLSIEILSKENQNNDFKIKKKVKTEQNDSKEKKEKNDKKSKKEKEKERRSDKKSKNKSDKYQKSEKGITSELDKVMNLLQKQVEENKKNQKNEQTKDDKKQKLDNKKKEKKQINEKQAEMKLVDKEDEQDQEKSKSLEKEKRKSKEKIHDGLGETQPLEYPKLTSTMEIELQTNIQIKQNEKIEKKINQEIIEEEDNKKDQNDYQIVIDNSQ